MSKSTNRIAWADAARGIGIVLVVFGHVERGLVGAGIAHGQIWSWTDYSLYTFQMPLFFLLAGMNVPASLAKGRCRFLEAKLWTIAYPYVLWSMIQGSILIALSSLTNGHAQASELLTIGWRPMGQFWFLYALMICQLAAIVLAERTRFIAGVAIVSYVGSTLLPQGGIVEETLHAFPFFAFGILVSERWLPRPPWDALRLTIAGSIGLALAIAFSGQLDGLNFDAVAALPASVCGIVLVISVSRLLSGAILDAVCALGRVSMTIYVMHILAAAGTRIALMRLHVPPNPWLYLAVCTVAGIALPVAAHAIFARLNLLPILGLTHFRARRPLAPALAKAR